MESKFGMLNVLFGLVAGNALVKYDVYWIKLKDGSELVLDLLLALVCKPTSSY